MNGFLVSPEFKVGLMVLVVSAIIGIMSIKVSEDPTLGGSKKAWFVTPDASGLVKNSAVKMAGIPVGVIRDIVLQDGQARIEIVVKSEVDLRESAKAAIKSVGILGDKHVEITPGNPIDPLLAEGGQIMNVSDSAGMDNVMGKIGEIADSFSGVAKALQEAVDKDGTNKHVLGRIVQNIEKLTADLSQVTGENKEQIREIVDQINSITRSLDSTLNDPNNGFKQTWAKIDKSVKNIEDITGRINRGEGTIGKLINDDSTIEEINTAIEGISGFLDTASKMQTAIDFHSEYLDAAAATKSYIGVKITPGLDRYYLIQVVDDPLGVVEKVDTSTTVSGSTTETKEVKTYHNKVKFSLQFAKNFYDFSVRGGLIENTGGFGFDYYFLRKQLKWSIEAFDFSKVNMRTALQYNVYKGIYVRGGYNDMLNKSDQAGSYLGAGIFLTNDDLKAFMSKVSF